MYDFDRILNRRGTNSSKWDYIKDDFGAEDLMPFWIADMDFALFPGIHEALKKRIGDGQTYGYTRYQGDYLCSVVKWNSERHNVTLDPEQILPVCGVVTGLALALLAFTKPDDRVVINTPVYEPFYSLVRNLGRELLCSPLSFKSEKYEIDFNNLEEQFKKGAKAYIICSPHNPVGRVWTESELRSIVFLCKKYGIQLISDEIHYDIVYSGNIHHSVLEIDESAILVTAPSKTFNIAGLKAAYISTKDKEKFQRIFFENNKMHMYVNLFGLTATIAAYNDGSAWVNELVTYLEGNCNFILDFFKDNLPDVYTYMPEATYLMWLDMSKLGMKEQELNRILIDEAKVALSPGIEFGNGYESHLRLNAGVPRHYLKQGLERICSALSNHKK